MMSLAAASAPLPLIGRTSSSIAVSGGMPSRASMGAHSRVSASSAPDARSMLTAVSSATSAGKMRMTVFSPSRAPSVSAEKTSVPVSTPQSPTPASSSGTVNVSSPLTAICAQAPFRPAAPP